MSKNRIGNLIIISTVQSNIFGEDDNTLTYFDKEVKTDGISGPVHLYIIDEDAEIKEGDHYLVQHNVEGHILSDNFILCKANKDFMCNHYIKNIGVYLKIIASSNKEINVPIIAIPVLKELCFQWNSKVIKPKSDILSYAAFKLRNVDLFPERLEQAKEYLKKAINKTLLTEEILVNLGFKKSENSIDAFSKIISYNLLLNYKDWATSKSYRGLTCTYYKLDDYFSVSVYDHYEDINNDKITSLTNKLKYKEDLELLIDLLKN